MAVSRAETRAVGGARVGCIYGHQSRRSSAARSDIRMSRQIPRLCFFTSFSFLSLINNYEVYKRSHVQYLDKLRRSRYTNNAVLALV